MDKKRKIVYLVGGLLYPNGMCRVLSQKVNWLAEHTDYEVYMILTEKAGAPWYYHMSPRVKWVNFDINFDELDTMPLFRKLWHYWHKQRRYRSMFTNYLMEVRPDITVCTVRREINFINDIRDGSHKVGEIHFNRENYRQFNKPWLPGWVNEWVTNRWKHALEREIRRLDQFVVLTEEDSRDWRGMRNMSVIPNPLAYLPDQYSDCSSKTVIAAGRYTEQKGFDLLIRAWQYVAEKHPDWRLNIYGGGDNEFYQRMANDLGLNGLVCCNRAVDDIYKCYRESSFFVLSSRYEGFGLVLAEAMSAGLPVVSFACPCGPRDIVTDGVDGLLVERGNIQALSEAICWMIDHDAERRQFGKRAVLSARRYEEERIMRRWVDLFDSL
jgi:glycosyltransferase involved in cell wall biosynthesis